MELSVRRAGELHTVRLKRTMSPSESFDTVTVRRLAGGIGYINLRTIGDARRLDATMDEFERTAPGIILDVRGYLSAVGTVIAHLIDHTVSVPRGAGGVVRATIDRDWETRTLAQFRAPEGLPDPSAHYRKPVVVLIDGRAGSGIQVIHKKSSPQRQAHYVLEDANPVIDPDHRLPSAA